MPAKQRGEYPDDWAEISKAVKDAADWCCVRCGEYHNPSAGYCLTVHHFDGNKSNCDEWNLMALCQRCHLSVQARVDPEIGLLHEPSNWIRPYIAGFYEAGFGIPGPTYDLEKWIKAFTETNNAWPDWAPTP